MLVLEMVHRVAFAVMLARYVCIANITRQFFIL